MYDNRYSIRTLMKRRGKVPKAENLAHIYTREPECQDQYLQLCNTKEIINIHDFKKHDSYMTHNLTYICTATVSGILTHMRLC